MVYGITQKSDKSIKVVIPMNDDPGFGTVKW